MHPHTTLLIQADIAFHRAAQFLSLTAIAAFSAKSDDSHTNLSWNIERQRLEGRWFHGIDGDYRLTLEPVDFELRWENRHRQVVEHLGLEETPVSEVREWWENSILQITGKSGKDTHLHYELPSSAAYQTDSFPKLAHEAVEQWVKWRSTGEKWLLQGLDLLEVMAQPRIWPHHFDTGLFIPAGNGLSIGAGIAPADELSEEPYLYLYGWKDGKRVTPGGSKAPTALGQWIEKRNWVGFILPHGQTINSDNDEITASIANALHPYLNA